MADRTVRVRLSAEVQQYIADMDKAAKATRETGSEAQKLAQRREAFQQLGAAMVAVGGAVTAIGVAALKTGIEYNTMQQTTRAALTTLLGSAQAANAQMDKLDEFARTSPFAKQTFIQAQQQMLAFGIETKKVIPYLDAVQDAVAAAGGSNAEIEAIVATMSKIQSSSKITAQDLNEFGNRGVNAAELIGSQMGKTGAQIRADITAGSLDATKALDALAAGMKDRFGGAAENVKETFAGAMDRVKAAWRDFSAEIAKPLVDPDGGGALVDFLNGLADAMRQFEKLPQPVKDATTALAGLTGAALLVGGTALLMVPKIADFKNSLETLNVTAGSTRTALSNAIPAVFALALVPIAADLVSWTDEMRNVTASAKDLQDELQSTKDITEQLSHGLAGGGMLRGVGMDAELAANNLRTLNTTVGELKAAFDNSVWGKALSVPLMGFGREAGNAKRQIEELDAALAAMVASGNTEQAAAGYEQFAEMAREAGWSQEKINEYLPQYTAASEDAARASDANANSLEELQGVAVDTTDAVKGLADEIRGFGSAQFDVEKATISFYDALDDLTENLASGAASLDATTEAGRNTRAAMLDVASSTNDYAASVAAAGGTEAEYQAILEQGRRKLIEVAVQLGMTEAEAKSYADQLIATPEVVRTRVEADTSPARNAINSFFGEMQGRRLTAYVDAMVAARGNADGGVYENGVRAFADGGFAPGIYPYTPGGIHKFAEEYSEAYISMDPARINRSRQVWVEAGERLGMGDVVKAISGASSPSLEGLSISGRLEIGGDGLARIVDGRIVRAFAPVSSTAVAGRFGV